MKLIRANLIVEKQRKLIQWVIRFLNSDVAFNQN